MITLDEITRDNVHGVLALRVADEQAAIYPRSNAYSIAEGMFPLDEDPVWMRAICNDVKPVGFMMTSETLETGDYFLWRMMIDYRSQNRGYGAEAMRLLIKRIVDKGNPRVLLLSHLKGNAEAGRFYESFGFTYTGNDLVNDDVEMSLRFA